MRLAKRILLKTKERNKLAKIFFLDSSTELQKILFIGIVNSFLTNWEWDQKSVLFISIALVQFICVFFSS